MNGTLKILLRDIHLPDPVSWWPPAPGWWALLVLSLLAFALVRSMLRARTRRRVRLAALSEFQRLSERFGKTQDVQELVRNLSVLLRRVCISYFPRGEVAALTGERWLDFLETGLGQRAVQGRFKEGPGRALMSAPYRKASDIDGRALLDLCGDWVRGLPPLAAGGLRGGRR